jgi:hypothetical protein
VLGQRVVLALVTGVVAFTAAEAYQAGQIARLVQSQGVTVSVAGIQTRVAPPAGGGGKTISLPPAADSVMSDMHVLASGVGVAAIVAVLLVTSGK